MNKFPIGKIIALYMVLTIIFPNSSFSQNDYEIITLRINKRTAKKTGFPVFDSLYMSEQRYLSKDTLVIDIKAIRKDSLRQSVGYFYYTPFNFSHKLLEKRYSVSTSEITNIKWVKLIFFEETFYFFKRKNEQDKLFILKKIII